MKIFLKVVSSLMATLITAGCLLAGNTVVSNATATTKKDTVTISQAGKSKKLNPTSIFSGFKVKSSKVSNKNLVSFDEKTLTVKAKSAGKTHIKLYNAKSASSATKVINYTIKVTVDTSAKSDDTWHNKTLIGATVWAKKDLTLYEGTKLKNKAGTWDYTVKSGSETLLRKGTITKTDDDKLKIKAKNKNGKTVEGWTNDKDHIYVNLSEINTNIQYQITNASKSIFIVGDGTKYFKDNIKSYTPSTNTEKLNKCEDKEYNKSNPQSSYKNSYAKLDGITGKRLYTYDDDSTKDGKVHSSKLDKKIYVAPVLWKFAKQIGYAECVAERNGYNLKIYDSYRPQNVCDKFWKSAVTADGTKAGHSLFTRTVGGQTWHKGWFVAKTGSGRTSDHARGIAVDLTMVYKNTDKEIYTQSNMHDLSCNSIKNVSESWYNTLTDVLSKIMTTSNSKKSALVGLASEWWHYNIQNSANYSATNYNVNY